MSKKRINSRNCEMGTTGKANAAVSTSTPTVTPPASPRPRPTLRSSTSSGPPYDPSFSPPYSLSNSPPYHPIQPPSSTSKIVRLVKEQRLSKGLSTELPPSSVLPSLSGSRSIVGGGSSVPSTSTGTGPGTGTDTGTGRSNNSVPVVASHGPLSSTSRAQRLSQRSERGSSGNLKCRHCRVPDAINDLENAAFELDAGQKEHEQHLLIVYRENDERKQEISAIQHRQQIPGPEQVHRINEQNENGVVPQGLGFKCPDCGRLYRSSLAYVLKKHRGNSACLWNQGFGGFRRGDRRGGGGGGGSGGSGGTCANFGLGRT